MRCLRVTPAERLAGALSTEHNLVRPCARSQLIGHAAASCAAAGRACHVKAAASASNAGAQKREQAHGLPEVRCVVPTPGAQHSQARQTEKVRHSVFVWQVGPLSSRHPTLWTGVLTHDGAAARTVGAWRYAVRTAGRLSSSGCAVPCRTSYGMSSQSAGPSLRRARAQRACRAPDVLQKRCAASRCLQLRSDRADCFRAVPCAVRCAVRSAERFDLA